MADSTITCPNCKSDIPLGEAVAHRLREELAADFEKERQRLTQAISEREAKIASERKAIEERSRAVADEISRGLDVERAKLRDAAEELPGLELMRREEGVRGGIITQVAGEGAIRGEVEERALEALRAGEGQRQLVAEEDEARAVHDSAIVTGGKE